tara:strand:- start:116 stop:280 length:165 start_codon:yes stop_codon:yes gene_type:complete
MSKKDDQYWIETVIMAGLNRLREDQEGNRLETYEDLYKEYDRVMLLALDVFKGL